MTDAELIARLRDAPADGLGTENLCLEVKLAECEVRLRKAVEALEFLEIAATGSGVPHPKERELLHDCIRKARATLAEIKLQSSEFATLKGESHEWL